MSEHLNTHEGSTDSELQIQEPVVLDAALEKAIADYTQDIPEGGSMSNQMEGATYNESFAEFMGGLPSVMSPDAYAELVDAQTEISEVAKAEFEAVGDVVALNALDAANESQPEAARRLAMVSTLGTNMASIDVEGESGEAETSVAEGEEHASFWNKHRKLQRVMLAAMSSLGLLAAQPAMADHGQREQVRAQAQAIGLNFLAQIAQNALARQGVLVDPRGPVPIPGTQYPVYGGVELPPPPVIHGGGHLPPVGGYPAGGYESDSRLQLQQQIIGLKQQLRRQAEEERNYAIAERTAYDKLRLDPSNVNLRRDVINYRAARETQRITIEQTMEQIRLAQDKLSRTP